MGGRQIRTDVTEKPYFSPPLGLLHPVALPVNYKAGCVAVARPAAMTESEVMKHAWMGGLRSQTL